MMTNTECNSNLLFIKYIYYTVQVEFCYNVAHMCRASSSLVELCSLCCPSSKQRSMAISWPYILLSTRELWVI